MAKITKKQADEREYIVPLKRETSKVPRHKRTPKAVKALKQFIAKHMRIPDRNIKKVKLSKWVNQELWFRGIKKPASKIKVNAKRKGENILVDLVDFPDKLKFAKLREERKNVAEKKIKEVKKKEKEEKSVEEKGKEVKNEEEKEKSVEEKGKEVKNEEEKEKSVEEAGKKLAQIKAKQEKHSTIAKIQKTQPVRKALQK